jgi:hypothetical protein
MPPRETAGSGGLPFVAMMEPANFGPRHDPTGSGRVDGARLGRVLAEREVSSRALVVRDVRAKHSSEMSLVEDDHVVQALAADRPDDAFDVRILPRRAQGGADGREAERFDGAAERRVEGRVAVVEEESRAGVVKEALAELLLGPRGGWMPRDVDMRMRRRSWARTTKTNRIRQVSGGPRKSRPRRLSRGGS